MGARQNQQPPVPETDTLALEDETLNTNKAATAIPLSVGECKTALRWMTPIYGARVTKVPSTTAGKGK